MKPVLKEVVQERKDVPFRFIEPIKNENLPVKGGENGRAVHYLATDEEEVGSFFFFLFSLWR